MKIIVVLVSFAMGYLLICYQFIKKIQQVVMNMFFAGSQGKQDEVYYLLMNRVLLIKIEQIDSKTTDGASFVIRNTSLDVTYDSSMGYREVTYRFIKYHHEHDNVPSDNTLVIRIRLDSSVMRIFNNRWQITTTVVDKNGNDVDYNIMQISNTRNMDQTIVYLKLIDDGNDDYLCVAGQVMREIMVGGKTTIGLVIKLTSDKPGLVRRSTGMIVTSPCGQYIVTHIHQRMIEDKPVFVITAMVAAQPTFLIRLL